MSGQKASGRSAGASGKPRRHISGHGGGGAGHAGSRSGGGQGQRQSSGSGAASQYRRPSSGTGHRSSRAGGSTKRRSEADVSLAPPRIGAPPSGKPRGSGGRPDDRRLKRSASEPWWRDPAISQRSMARRARAAARGKSVEPAPAAMPSNLSEARVGLDGKEVIPDEEKPPCYRFRVRCTQNWRPRDEFEIGVTKGDTFIANFLGSSWSFGTNRGRSGWFPAEYVVVTKELY